MWFRNLVVHRLPADWSHTAADLESALGKFTLQPCTPFEMRSRGWLPASTAGGLVHTVNGHHMICLGTESKLLPGSVIRQVTQDQAQAQAKEQGFPVGRRQMRDIRMRVTDELRARALSRRSKTRAWIDPERGWFVVDAASLTRAEELTDWLRTTLGSFAPAALETDRSPHASMTAWLVGRDSPQGFAIDDELELQSADKAKSIIRYMRHPIDGKEVQGHLSAGKYVTRLGLTWNDRISFVLTDKLQVRRLQFLEVSNDATQGNELDPEEQFDVDFAVMAGELGKLLADLARAVQAPEPAAKAA